MTKIIHIIYYVLFAIKKMLDTKSKKDTQERRERIEDNPSKAFQDKFTKDKPEEGKDE